MPSGLVQTAPLWEDWNLVVDHSAGIPCICPPVFQENVVTVYVVENSTNFIQVL